MSSKSFHRLIVACSVAASSMLAVIPEEAYAIPVQISYSNPTWNDVNKLHSGGDWSSNYWVDSNGNGKWEAGEPLSDTWSPGWSAGTDNSCWIASAANMLSSAGFGNAEAIYWEMVSNFGWQDGGLQHQALQWYIVNHPTMNVHVKYWYYLNGVVPGASPWSDRPFELAADYLSSGYQVGIGIWPPIGIGHALTFQGYDWTASQMTVTDSDQKSGLISDISQETDGYTLSYDPIGQQSWSIAYVFDGNTYQRDVWYIAVLVIEPYIPGIPGGIALLAGTLAFWTSRKRHDRGN